MSQINQFQNTEQAYSTTVTPVLQPKPTWSVWRGNPWNPTCGRISLETGAKAFLRGYMYITIFFISTLVFTLFLVGYLATTQRPNYVIKINQTEDFINEVVKYETQSFAHGYLLLLLVVLGWMCLTAYSCYKCRKALEQGTVAQMKKHFWAVFFFVAFDLLGSFLLDRDTLFILILELPMGIFSVFGILFVYNYILERIQTASATFVYSRDSTLESV